MTFKFYSWVTKGKNANYFYAPRPPPPVVRGCAHVKVYLKWFNEPSPNGSWSCRYTEFDPVLLESARQKGVPALVPLNGWKKFDVLEAKCPNAFNVWRKKHCLGSINGKLSFGANRFSADCVSADLLPSSLLTTDLFMFTCSTFLIQFPLWLTVLFNCPVKWTQCTTSCGPGYQMRAVKCVVGSYGAVMDDTECNAATRPTDTQVRKTLMSLLLSSLPLSEHFLFFLSFNHLMFSTLWRKK